MPYLDPQYTGDWLVLPMIIMYLCKLGRAESGEDGQHVLGDAGQPVIIRQKFHLKFFLVF